MEALIPLNLPKATLTLTRKDNVIFVNCLIRKKKNNLNTRRMGETTLH
jgi:hypothetical protein